MPTKQITVCARCGRTTCDGSIWKMISVRSKITGSEDIDKVHPDNIYNCSLDNGRSRLKLLKNKKVGDQVELEFDNWIDPSYVTVLKVEE